MPANRGLDAMCRTELIIIANAVPSYLVVDDQFLAAFVYSYGDAMPHV
jgi:hypothetical protein